MWHLTHVPGRLTKSPAKYKGSQFFCSHWLSIYPSLTTHGVTCLPPNHCLRPTNSTKVREALSIKILLGFSCQIKQLQAMIMRDDAGDGCCTAVHLQSQDVLQPSRWLAVLVDSLCWSFPGRLTPGVSPVRNNLCALLHSAVPNLLLHCND